MSMQRCPGEMAISPASYQHCTIKPNFRMSAPAGLHGVACMCMLCYPAQQKSTMSLLREA